MVIVLSGIVTLIVVGVAIDQRRKIASKARDGALNAMASALKTKRRARGAVDRLSAEVRRRAGEP